MAARTRTFLLTLLVTVAVPVAFFGILEGLLALVGVEPLADDPDYEAAARQRNCRVDFGAPRTWCRPRSDERRGRLVLTLGGSSVFGYRAEGRSFPTQLQELYDRERPGEVQVVNLGRPCKDSIFVRRCLEYAISARPEVVVVYAGHNDYANFGFSSPSRRIFLEEQGWIYDLEGAASRTRVFSGLARMLRASPGDAPKDVSVEQLERGSQVILDEFTDNISAVIDLAERHGAEVVLVTVVSNLYEFPYRKARWDLTALPVDEPSPRLGLWLDAYTGGIERFRAGDRAAALAAFKRARDWRPEGRARSQLNERLREISRRFPHVHLVDFERTLDRLGLREGIGCNYFGGEDWCDQFHPNAGTHALIARAVFRRIESLRADRGAEPRP